VTALTLILIGFLHQTSAADTTWRKYTWAGGAFWRYYSDKKDWNSAQKHCQNEGAYLAVADSSSKLHKLKRKLSYDAWIGLHKSGSQWKWVTGGGASGGSWLSSSGGPCAYARRVSPSRSSGDDGKFVAASCSTRKGFVCESKNACVVKNPCKNGGKCGGVGKSLTCSCPSGFQGQYCEQDKRACYAFNPCKNRAKCTSRGVDYSCSCPAGFAGKNCEQDKRPCHAFNPCKNGAKCTNKGSDYSCSCHPGYAGKNCEQDKRPCHAFNPCKNGAKCMNKGAHYSCSCHAGYAGTNCEQDKRPCYAFNPCKNGAKCTNKGKDYTCSCHAGYAGKNCEQDKRPCYGFNPCKNGARCLNQGVNYQCVCPAGFKGKNCESSCGLMSRGGLPQKLDLIILIDGSRSVGLGSFRQGLEFVNKIVQKMDISPSKGRVGFIQYAHKVQSDRIIDFKKSAALGKTKLLNAISEIPYMDGGTNVGPALEEAIKMFHNEGRSNVAKYIMVLSDGESFAKEKITTAMKKIRAAKIQTFSVGVGADAKGQGSRAQLLEIAQGNGKHIFEVDNYEQLNDNILKKIIVSQCD